MKKTHQNDLLKSKLCYLFKETFNKGTKIPNKPFPQVISLPAFSPCLQLIELKTSLILIFLKSFGKSHSCYDPHTSGISQEKSNEELIQPHFSIYLLGIRNTYNRK